jgi:hypothetical protein
MKNIILIALTIMVIAMGFLMFDDFNRAGVLGSKGYLEEGSKFGVEVGLELGEARTVLREKGLRPVDLTAPSSCHGRTYSADRQLELWYDDTWRRGTICLSSVDRRVVSISWSFNWMTP